MWKWCVRELGLAGVSDHKRPWIKTLILNPVVVSYCVLEDLQKRSPFTILSKLPESPPNLCFLEWPLHTTLDSSKGKIQHLPIQSDGGRHRSVTVTWCFPEPPEDAEQDEVVGWGQCVPLLTTDHPHPWSQHIHWPHSTTCQTTIPWCCGVGTTPTVVLLSLPCCHTVGLGDIEVPMPCAGFGFKCVLSYPKLNQICLN